MKSSHSSPLRNGLLMMTSFKEILSNRSFNHELKVPTVSVSSENGHTLYLKLDKKEVIEEASFLGPFDPWLAGLCALVTGRNLHYLHQLGPGDLESYFKSDQTFCDLWSEREEELWFLPVEMLRAALDRFEGREHLYLPTSALVCRCFGVREDQILKGIKIKAGMGCRSCLPQIEELKKRKDKRKSSKRRYYKQMSYADWLILTDEKLNTFPEKEEWGMEVGSFKGQSIVISYTRKVSQKEEEQMALKLQDFLGPLVDSDLSFFLRRS